MNKIKVLTLGLLLLALNGQAAGFIFAASGKAGSIDNILMGEICTQIGKSAGIGSCIAKSTTGSKENLKEMLSNKASIGIIQSNMLDRMSAEEKQTVTPLLSLYDRTVILAVSSKAQIEKIADLKGRKVNLGEDNSEELDVSRKVLIRAGLNPDSDVVALNIPGDSYNEVYTGLCEGVIDAAFLLEATPSERIKNLIAECGVKLVGLDLNLIREIQGNHSLFLDSEIPSGVYKGQGSISSIAVKTLLVANTQKIDVDTAYLLTKLTDSSYEVIKNTIPELKSSQESAATETADLPGLNPGAIRYLKEKGVSVK